MRTPQTLPLRCACGELRGTLDARPTSGVRCVCYCDDCRAYARWLGRDDVLDAHGGTDVVPTWPARVRLEAAGSLAVMRLSDKGMYRWYAACCRTPLANVMANPRMPFNGVLRRAIDADDATLDATFGPAQGVQGRYAIGGCPPGAHETANLGIIAGALGLLARGFLAGGHQPSPWFGPDGQPVVVAEVLDVGARMGLRG